jgi:hypothetical protein
LIPISYANPVTFALQTTSEVGTDKTTSSCDENTFSRHFNTPKNEINVSAIRERLTAGGAWRHYWRTDFADSNTAVSFLEQKAPIYSKVGASRAGGGCWAVTLGK